MVERDLTTRDTMMAHCTSRLERLTTINTELETRLKNSLRENKEVRQCLEDWLRKRECLVCTSAEADRLTECGHLFCKECLDKWEKEWYRESDRGGDMQGILKGILTCPKCRRWVVMSKVKHMYHS